MGKGGRQKARRGVSKGSGDPRKHLGTGALDAPPLEHSHSELCIHCGLDVEFEMPMGLADAAHGSNVVIFAGAGVSTETSAVFARTFFSEIADEVDGTDAEDFPTVMQRYEDRDGRPKLVGRIRDRFDYVDGFFRLRDQARKFHRELATMPYLHDIITTNWDTYFEEECKAIPFLTGEDFAFLDVSPRRVYKIHGSINSLSSLIITQSDYKRRLDELRNNVLGASIRKLLATKTVVFVGYSLGDWNFRLLYEALRADMGAFAPRAFVVSPFDVNGLEAFPGLEHIPTSGVKFLKDLKEELTATCFLPDLVYERVARLLDDALKAHHDVAVHVSHLQYPTIIHCWSYQQGLIDACRRILDRRVSGEYSQRHRVAELVRSYDRLVEEQLKGEHFWDAAYLDGYANGMLVLLDDNEELEIADATPLYYIYGSRSGMRSTEDLHAALDRSLRKAPKARAEAEKISDITPDDMIMTRAPFLPSRSEPRPGKHLHPQ